MMDTNKYSETGAIIVSSSGKIISVNDSCKMLLGYTNKELEGKEVKELLPENPDESNPLGALGFIDSFDVVNTMETRAVMKDKQTLPVEVVSIKLSANKEDFFVCTIKNTSKKELAKEIENTIHTITNFVMHGNGVKQITPILCRNLLNIFKLNSVWIATRKTNGDLKINATAGLEVEDIFVEKIVSWNDIPKELPHIARCMQQCQTAVQFAGIDMGGGETYTQQIISIPLLFCKDAIGILEIRPKEELDTETKEIINSLALRIAVIIKMAQDQRLMNLLSTAISSAANAVFITDTEGQIIWSNQAFSEMSGYSAEEIRKQNVRILKSGLQTDDFYKDLWLTVKSGRLWSGEETNRQKFGALYDVRQTISPMLNAEGEVSHFVVIHDDLTEKKENERIIAQMANYDRLTGLPNRTLFTETLNNRIKESEGTNKKICVIFVDVCNFNIINDSAGHTIGDMLLRDISDRLSYMTSSDDIISRFGGDNFALATQINEEEEASEIVRRVIDSLQDTVEIEGKEIALGACAGVAIYPKDANEANKLLNYADMAMHKAEQISSNSFCFFSPKMNEETEQRITLERDLRRALSNNEFILNYQPQIDLHTNTISCWEALIRWKHPLLGLVPPVNFIPIAENSGLILPIGEWVLKESLRQWRKWRELGLPNAIMAVNLSAIQFKQEDLVECVEKALMETGVNPDNLELELTESVIMQDAEKAEQALNKISDIGVKVAIDDFGTGYSSLSYLKRFPVDKLKIDRSFIIDLYHDDNNRRIVNAIIQLGHSLGLEVIAEGIENNQQFELLKKFGCDAIQGYLLGKPMSPDEIPAYVAGKSFLGH